MAGFLVSNQSAYSYHNFCFLRCLCNSLLAIQHSVNYLSDTSFTLFTLLWFIARTRQEINLKWKKNFKKIFWTSNLALQEGLLKHKWLLVVTLDNVYMFESTINISRQWKYNWLCSLLLYSETIRSLVCFHFINWFCYWMTGFYSLWFYRP